jgi:spermidine/putrescine transport system substrate-binding protein
MSVDRRARDALERLGVGRPLTRREFLRRTSIAGLVVGTPSVLWGCGTSGAGQSDASCVSTDLSSTEKTLFFSNWPEYIDQAKGGRVLPTLEAFKESSGIDVKYNTDINSNTEFFAKVQNQLGDCQPTGRDIIVVTDWMAAKMINLGWMQKLDHANLPNVDAHLKANLKNPDWDPERQYSVPWQSGLTGIAYNAAYTGEVTSMEELLTRADLKGKVSLLDEMHDTMGFLLKITGADPVDFTEEEWAAAIAELETHVASGQIRRFTGNDYIDDLNAGNLAACEAWSGDVIAMQFDNPDIKWVVPDEGLSIWSDNMLVPNKAEHKANAEALMDYYYDPEVAATVAAWVNYICPVEGAREAMEAIDPTLVDNPLIFPDETFLSATWAFMDLDEATATKYETEFSRAVGA